MKILNRFFFYDSKDDKGSIDISRTTTLILYKESKIKYERVYELLTFCLAKNRIILKENSSRRRRSFLILLGRPR